MCVENSSPAMVVAGECTVVTTPVWKDTVQSDGAKKPDVCSNVRHGTCKSKSSKIFPIFTMNGNGKWFETCIACRAHACDLKREEVIKESGDVDTIEHEHESTPSACSSLSHYPGICRSNSVGIIPTFSKNPRTNEWYKRCDECRSYSKVAAERHKERKANGQVNKHQKGTETDNQTCIRMEKVTPFLDSYATQNVMEGDGVQQESSCSSMMNISLASNEHTVPSETIASDGSASTSDVGVCSMQDEVVDLKEEVGPTVCSNLEKKGCCKSKSDGVTPDFSKTAQGRWYKQCDRCRMYRRAYKKAEDEKRKMEEDVRNQRCCRACCKWKDLECFGTKMAGGEKVITKTCNPCLQLAKGYCKTRYEKLKKLAEDEPDPDYSWCTCCGRRQHKSQFSRREKNKSGINKTCDQCFEKNYRSTKNSIRCKINEICDGADYRGYSVTMTDEEFEQILRAVCVYCGVIDKYGINGADRIDSSIPEYCKGNVVPCCARCNRTKLVLSVDIFVKRMYHYVYLHYHNSSVQGKEFPEAFSNPNPLRRPFSGIRGMARSNGYQCLFTEDEYERVIADGKLCEQCLINPATGVVRYQRDSELSPSNYTAVCTCCGSMFINITPCDLPDMAKTIVLHSEKTGLLKKIENGQPIFVFEEDMQCSNEE